MSTLKGKGQVNEEEHQDKDNKKGNQYKEGVEDKEHEEDKEDEEDEEGEEDKEAEDANKANKGKKKPVVDFYVNGLKWGIEFLRQGHSILYLVEGIQKR